MRRNVSLLTLAVMVLVTCAGCINDPPYMQPVKCEYDPGGRRMLVIPFKDPLWDYFESSEGRAVADYTAYYILTQRITPVTCNFFPNVRMMYQELAHDPLAAWKKIAEKLGYDLVLVGQIEVIRSDPRNLNLVKEEIILSAQLHDMDKNGEVVWHMTERKIVYPKGWEYQDGMDTFSLHPKKLRLQLLRAAGEVVGKSFHDHMEPRESVFGDPM